MTIVFAGQQRIEAVYEEAKELVRLGLGIERAFLSDESCVSDFSLDEEDLDKLSVLAGRSVDRHDYIVDLAEEYSGGGSGGQAEN